MSLAHRVVARFLTAGIQDELETRFEKLLSYDPRPPPPSEIREFCAWLAANFKLGGRVPKEGKMAQEELAGFWKTLQQIGLDGGASNFAGFFRSFWDHRIQREMPNIIRYLSEEGTGKALVTEKKVGGNTYHNLVGASAERFDGLIDTIEGAFSTLKGWRRKALDGGVHVVFAGPKDFRGTASGTYKQDRDQLLIRATPGGRLDKGGTGYGGLTYVIVHELGHRYAHKHRLPVDFEKSEWFTTPYSKKDTMSGGESFAELFAISNFGITGAWDQSIVDRFEELMG